MPADFNSALPALSEATLWAILNDELADETVNQLAWQTLGYQPTASGCWEPQQVAPEWLEKFPQPPNFIESRPATVQLTRAIPKADKQLLKSYLGFKGYPVNQLVPRLTRRATVVSWLLSVMRQRGQIRLPEA